MDMIESGFVVNTRDNERGNYTIWKKYEVKHGMIEDDGGSTTNFSNVRKWFKKSN